MKILRYTTETVSKYWDSENYRIFTLKMNNQDNLILTSSNPTNLKLYGTSEKSIGKSLYEIIEKEHAERWNSRFNQWKELGFTSYVAYFDDRFVGWDTHVEIINDTVFAIGKKLAANQLNLESFDNHEFFNHYFINQEDFLIVTILALENDFFEVEAIDSSLSFDFSSFIGKDISKITLYCSNILNNQVYQKCLESKKVVHLAEKCTLNNDRFFWDVHLYPYLNSSKIILYGKVINEATYHQIQKQISNFYGLYPETDFFGVCEINYDDEDNPYIIGCNHFFKNLLSQTDLNLSSIVSNLTFQKCLKTSSKETGEFILQSRLNEIKRFKISVTHISEIGNQLFLVALMPEEKELLNMDTKFKTLSVREREILTHVTNGLTNRYIAKKLNITEGTVKKTIYNGYKKLGVCSRVELVNSLREKL
jgi:DNA-binding CsgD family transcriptional regulator